MAEVPDSVAAVSSSYTNPKVFVDLPLKENRFGFIRWQLTNIYLMSCSINFYADDSVILVLKF